MQDFIDYLKQEALVEHLLGYYKNGLIKQSDENLLKKIIEKLNYIKDGRIRGAHTNSLNLDFDLFGDLYEKTLIHEEKKKLGEFYTPVSVVNYILDAVGYKSDDEIETKTLIDISCGSGNFLIEAVRRLIERHLDIYNRKKISEFTVGEAKSVITQVQNNIYGIDINPIACILCQINIHFTLFDFLSLIRISDKNYQLPGFKIKNCNAVMLDRTEKYDYTVGNPPYLFIRDIPDDHREIIEIKDFEGIDVQYDYYQIFIELGIKILKNQGFFGYIVPDSVLALSNRSVIRKFIYNTTIIKEIYHIGPKFEDPVVSNVILILQRENSKTARENNKIKIINSSLQEKLISQVSLKKWNFKFLIHLNDTDSSILEYLGKNYQTLNDLINREDFNITLIRGVELTKSGEIIFCENCKKYLPVPKKQHICRVCGNLLNEDNKEKIIHDSLPQIKEKDREIFLYSINRYQKNQYKYIDTSKVGINYKNFKNYEDRIIIRQISQNNLLCATHDIKLSITTQSFYNLKVNKSPIPEFNNFYLLGIINSTLLSYFFIKSFGSYKKLFPRVLIEKIRNFPMKIPSSSKEKEKAKEITRLVKLSLNNREKINHNQKDIDTLIFDLYLISDNKRDYILNFMKSLTN